MARPRKPKVTLTSLEDCRDAMKHLLITQTEREELKANQDRQIAKTIEDFEGAIAKRANEAANLTAALRAYYMTHLKDLEAGGKRSVDLTYGVMGRRLSPPALKLLNKAWTWAAATVAAAVALGEKFVRMAEPELDKEGIKKADFSADQLESCGLRLEQQEQFFAEPTRPPAQEGKAAA